MKTISKIAIVTAFALFTGAVMSGNIQPTIDTPNVQTETYFFGAKESFEFYKVRPVASYRISSGDLTFSFKSPSRYNNGGILFYDYDYRRNVVLNFDMDTVTYLNW